MSTDYKSGNMAIPLANNSTCVIFFRGGAVGVSQCHICYLKHIVLDQDKYWNGMS